jgi:hypothetical protein
VESADERHALRLRGGARSRLVALEQPAHGAQAPGACPRTAMEVGMHVAGGGRLPRRSTTEEPPMTQEQQPDARISSGRHFANEEMK